MVAKTKKQKGIEKAKQLISMFTVAPEHDLFIGRHIGEAKVGTTMAYLSIHARTGALVIQYKGRDAFISSVDYVVAACEAIELVLKKKKRKKKAK